MRVCTGLLLIALSGGCLKPAAPLQLPEDAPRVVARGPHPGMLAPDIEGEDIDGQFFRLSDYRGKVVLLDFWGHW